MTEYDDPIVGEIKASVAFPVDVECEGYPDVIFNVIFERHPDQLMIEQTVSALEHYMYKYNRKHFLSLYTTFPILTVYRRHLLFSLFVFIWILAMLIPKH